MQTPQAKLKQIERLLSAFPTTANSNTDPVQNLRNYLEAVEDWPADDVDAAVEAFIKGTVPGFDCRFAPTAPMLGAQCRRYAEERARREALARSMRPSLPARPVEHSPEERARIMAMAKAAGERLAAVTAADDAEREREKAARWQRTNERFAPDMDEDAVRKRLGFTVGDRDGDEWAA